MICHKMIIIVIIIISESKTNYWYFFFFYFKYISIYVDYRVYKPILHVDVVLIFNSFVKI